MELSKKLKFDYTNKWYFEKQTDHLMPVRRPGLVIVNSKKKKKRTYRIVDFAVPTDYKVKIKENEKRDKYLELVRELKKKKSKGTWWWRWY